jgi:thioredoxin 1
MRRASLVAVLAVSASLAVAGCSSSDASPAPLASAHQPAAAPPPSTGLPRLIFFMNPNGRPCQVQDEILRGMPDLLARAQLVTYRTTEPGDIARFEQFGIRSLPQLVLTDASGAELRRATPGIQQDAQIRRLLAP